MFPPLCYPQISPSAPNSENPQPVFCFKYGRKVYFVYFVPTPTSDSDSLPRLTYPTIFSRLSTSILTFLEAVELNLQRHPYINIRFRFLSSPYISYDFFPPLYLDLTFS